MQNFTFKNVDEYREWRAHWRREYKNCVKRITHSKQYRKTCNSVESIKTCSRLLRHDQMTARSLLMARQAVEFAHKINKAAKAA